LRLLARSDIERLLGYRQCIDEMRAAMITTSQRDCSLPLRQFMPVPRRSGKLGLMPGYLGGGEDCFGVKIVSKFERPADDPHGSHVGAVLLFAADTGLPLALLEGGTLTAIRTASMTAAATDALAGVEARHLLIVGAGEEAWHHARALLCVRPFETVSIWARNPDRAARLIDRLTAVSLPSGALNTPRWCVTDDLADSVAAAEVICTVTSAKEPFIRGEWLRSGQHINLVGSAIPTTAEVDDLVVSRSRFFVDYREAAFAAAGELLGAMSRGVVTAAHVCGEIGEVFAGSLTGRGHVDDITVYKSLGVTTQDLAAAMRVWREAERENIGSVIDMML
jgi:ornithine cyclodeaminase/alanine dehydrogenase-like protein (mu-crystallin family)